MSEFITLQVGQCGNQIGHAFWPLALEEHGLMSGGKVKCKREKNEALHSFFHNPKGEDCWNLNDMKKHGVKARALLIDMENAVTERLHNSKLKDIFERECTLTNYPGSGNNWAVGHFRHGTEQKERIMEMVRSSVEKCDHLHGFINMFSLGGGTGSGLGTAIVGHLSEHYPKIDRIVLCIHPGENQDVVTSPYNVALSLAHLSEYATCVLPVDNKSLLGICERLQPTKEMKLWEPYRNMNSIVVKLLLHLTSGARFPGPSNFDLSDLSTNMVPFPGIHFLSSSLCPLTFMNEEEIPVVKRKNELLKGVCSTENALMSVAPTKGLVYCATLFARGGVSLSSLRSYVDRFEETVDMAEWARSGVKTALCSVPPADHSSSMLCLSNNSLMGSFVHSCVDDFERLYRKKAHVHHYCNVDGFDDQFTRSLETLTGIVKRYRKTSTNIRLPRINVAL